MWTFTTLEPYGYEIEFHDGKLNFLASNITGGEFGEGRAIAPLAAIRTTSGYNVTAGFRKLIVQSDMDLFASVVVGSSMKWGEYSRTTGRPTFYTLTDNPAGDSGSFYLSAAWKKPYYPADTVWHMPILTPPAAALERDARLRS